MRSKIFSAVDSLKIHLRQSYASQSHIPRCYAIHWHRQFIKADKQSHKVLLGTLSPSSGSAGTAWRRVPLSPAMTSILEGRTLRTRVIITGGLITHCFRSDSHSWSRINKCVSALPLLLTHYHCSKSSSSQVSHVSFTEPSSKTSPDVPRLRLPSSGCVNDVDRHLCMALDELCQAPFVCVRG